MAFLKALIDVAEALMTAAWQVIMGIIILIVIVFRRRLVSGWRRLTDKVLYWLTWLHIRRQLPEDLEGPFGWRGEGQQTIELAEGEQLEFVLIPSPASIWLMRQPVSNPKRERELERPVLGAPSLLFLVFVLPFLTEMTLFFGWFFLWLFKNDLPAFPPRVLWLLFGLLGLFLLIPIYWVYEWNRRHYRLVVTTLVAYIVSVKAITREFHRSPNPMELVEEVVLDSSWSERPGIFGRVLGGWLHEARDVGDAFMGTRVQEAADFLRFFVHISSLGEILHALRTLAKARRATREIALKMAQEFRLRGYAEEATVGLAMPGQRSSLVEAMRRSEAILSAWRAEHPGGEKVNLLDPRILGFTRWNLETGEPKK